MNMNMTIYDRTNIVTTEMFNNAKGGLENGFNFFKRGKMYSCYLDNPEGLEKIRQTCIAFKNEGNALFKAKQLTEAEEQYRLGLAACEHCVLDGVEYEIANNLA